MYEVPSLARGPVTAKCDQWEMQDVKPAIRSFAAHQDATTLHIYTARLSLLPDREVCTKAIENECHIILAVQPVRYFLPQQCINVE